MAKRWIHDEEFATRRFSMMRIMANAATVRAALTLWPSMIAVVGVKRRSPAITRGGREPPESGEIYFKSFSRKER